MIAVCIGVSGVMSFSPFVICPNGEGDLELTVENYVEELGVSRAVSVEVRRKGCDYPLWKGAANQLLMMERPRLVWHTNPESYG